jgi:hypothetical protein
MMDRNRALSFMGGKKPVSIKMSIDDFDMLKVLGKGAPPLFFLMGSKLMGRKLVVLD